MSVTPEHLMDDRVSIIVAARGCDFNFDQHVAYDGPGAFECIPNTRERLLAAAILELANNGLGEADAALDGGSIVSQGRYAVRTDEQGFHYLLSFDSATEARRVIEAANAIEEGDDD